MIAESHQHKNRIGNLRRRFAASCRELNQEAKGGFGDTIKTSAGVRGEGREAGERARASAHRLGQRSALVQRDIRHVRPHVRGRDGLVHAPHRRR